MKVLVIGSGGREHALCRKFLASSRVTKIYCADGNAGIAAFAECIAIKPDDIEGLTGFAEREKIDLTFVGGETSLALGIVDEFESRGLRIIGPSKAASQLEASKTFAKNFMARHGVPTANFATAFSIEDATNRLENGSFGDEQTPVVIKADGLAAGKGVVVAANRAEAVNAIKEMESLVGQIAAEKIVIEECLIGKEVSILLFANGEHFALMPPTRDHKRIGENDTGPNTGGMGAITDASLIRSDQLTEIVETIVRPTLKGCIDEGFRFRGILFLGVMMTDGGPKLLEYNVRFGDPETQAILVRLETDIVDICEAMLAEGDKASLVFQEIKWKPGSSACVVLAAANYPAKASSGDMIHGTEKASMAPGVEVFHAGTAIAEDSGDEVSSKLVTAGGRVLGVTATGESLATALETAYKAVADISFKGMQFRRDIGK